MVVEVLVKNVYGTDLIYPYNMTAKQLASLTGKKTLAAYDIATIKELGFTIKQVTEALEV